VEGNYSLLEERQVAYLDPYAERILEWLNSHPGLRTTSSCIGRITLIEGYWPWERKGNSRIVFKTHYPITPAVLALGISQPFEPLWLKVTGPIVHFRAKTPECAAGLLDAARSEGFKHSGIISIDLEGSEWCCVVEVTAPTQFSSPLKLDGVIMASGVQLAVLARRANRALAEGRRRLARLAWRVRSGLAYECP